MTYHQWTTSAERLVRENYEARGSVWCAQALGIPTAKVRGKARKLGLRTVAKSPRGRSFSTGHDSRRGPGRPFNRKEHAQPAGIGVPDRPEGHARQRAGRSVVGVAA